MELEGKGGELGSNDEGMIKNLMDLRLYLEKRIQQLEDEAEKLKALFKIVDEVIVTKSFRRAEVVTRKPTAAAAPPTKAWEEVPLKTSSGTLLAKMHVGESELRIVPDAALPFNFNTPPFQSFLINRVLEPMRAVDRETSERGEITPDNILSYEVIREGEVVREVRVKNFGPEKRLREITSTSRWTLEKMYERTHPQGESYTQ